MGLKRPVSKVFDGEKFFCYASKSVDRTTADLNAMQYRRRGFRARVVSWGTGFTVFTCPAGNPESVPQ